MKMAFLVCNSYNSDRLMKLLAGLGIDYYTGWDKAIGKGHGTEPHLGTRSFGSTNTVLMIAFQEEAPLQSLICGIEELNPDIRRPADRYRLFQLPLERIV